jgi:hypothetical protein
VPHSVVNVQKEVKAAAGDAIEVSRLEMLDLDEAFERTAAAESGGLRSPHAVKDQSNAMNCDARTPW